MMLVLRYGSNGCAIADPMQPYDPEANVVTAKFAAIIWRKKSRRWTGRVLVDRSYVIRIATPADLKKYKVPAL